MQFYNLDLQKSKASVLLILLLTATLTFGVLANNENLCVKAVTGAVFEDGFESGSFDRWESRTYRTNQETTSIVTSPVYAGVYSAKFTNDGSSTYERAYVYRPIIPSSSELYARGYFYVAKSGIAQNSDNFYFIKLTSANIFIAYAGWKQNSNGRVCWHLMIRDGTNYAAAYSAATPALNTWYCVELHWSYGTTDGLGELYVNGVLVCSIKNKNTAYYGSASAVQFGLPELYSCTSTIVLLDNAVISTSYIGPDSPPAKYSLIIGAAIGGTTNPIEGTYQYDANTQANIQAFPDVGRTLSHWLLNNTNVGNANPYALTMNANYKLTAVFTEKQGVTVGIYPGRGRTIWQYETDLGVKFDHILQFQTVKALNYSKITTYLDKGYDVILNIEFQDSFANLKQIAAGAYDAYLIKLAEAITKDGRSIWLRPLHEFNGNWYNWGTLYPGNAIADFVPAWKHVVQLFRDKNTPVKFQLNYNRYNGKDDLTPFSAFWPGDQWVDMVVITCYNRAYTDQWHQYWHTFAEDFDNAYHQVIGLTAKPIGVAEMSSTSHGGNKSQWIIDAFNSIAYDYPRVQQVTWFLMNKTVNGILWDWDLNTSEEKQAFKEGMNLLTTVRNDGTIY